MSNCKEFRIIYANLSDQGGKRMPTLCNIYTPEGNCVYARIYCHKKDSFPGHSKKFIYAVA